MENKYSWRLPGLYKVDVNVAMQELDRIKTEKGALTAEVIVEEAAKEDSPLHLIFEWDDTKAAAKWRHQQARVMLNNIEVTIVQDGKEREISVFEVTSANGREYKSIDTFNSEDINRIVFKTKLEITALKNKLSVYNKFDKVIVKLDEAVQSFGEEDTASLG